MSLRDYLAIHAPFGAIDCGETSPVGIAQELGEPTEKLDTTQAACLARYYRVLARRSYQYADALLAARM
jgi:hypothetical protein